MFGHRPDSTLVTGLSPMRRFMPYVSPRRSESLVYSTQTIGVDAAIARLEVLNADRPDTQKITLFHLLLRAIARTLEARPKLNRFTMGSKLWQRNAVWITFSAKRSLDEHAPILTVKRRFDRQETLAELTEDLLGKLNAGRAGALTTADKEMGLLLRLPGPLIRLALKLGAFADRWGLLPGSLIESDPLYTSVFVANLGSVGLDGGYHHLWEWGNCPIFCVMGRLKSTDEGQVVTLHWTLDERIADGFYVATGLEQVSHFMNRA